MQFAQADTQSKITKEQSSHRTAGNMHRDFSKYIRNKFFSIEETGETIIFAVDEVVINKFIGEQEINFEVFQNGIAGMLRFSWKSIAIGNNNF